jgi:hypothetical protein
MPNQARSSRMLSLSGSAFKKLAVDISHAEFYNKPPNSSPSA